MNKRLLFRLLPLYAVRCIAQFLRQGLVRLTFPFVESLSFGPFFHFLFHLFHRFHGLLRGNPLQVTCNFVRLCLLDPSGSLHGHEICGSFFLLSSHFHTLFDSRNSSTTGNIFVAPFTEFFPRTCLASAESRLAPTGAAFGIGAVGSSAFFVFCSIRHGLLSCIAASCASV